jgi:hypothetical protein
MILYHFTRPELLEAILRDGLTASCSRADNNMTNGKPAVWLTERDTLVPTLKTRRILLSRGILCGPGCSNLPDATVCLRAVIPSHDRRLAHWLSWLKKRLHGYDLDDPLLLEDGIHKWVYFGDIPPARLTVFKHVPRTEPYWELPHHEAWRTTGAVAVFDPPELEADLLAGRDGPPKYVEAMRRAAYEANPKADCTAGPGECEAA